MEAILLKLAEAGTIQKTQTKLGKHSIDIFMVAPVRGCLSTPRMSHRLPSQPAPSPSPPASSSGTRSSQSSSSGTPKANHLAAPSAALQSRLQRKRVLLSPKVRLPCRRPLSFSLSRTPTYLRISDQRCQEAPRIISFRVFRVSSALLFFWA